VAVQRRIANMSALIVIPLLGLIATFKICCGSGRLSENSRRLRVYYRAFLEENYSKPPEFYSPANLRYFDDFYSADLEEVQNPLNAAWWPSVTQADIDAAFPTRNAMHAHLTNSLA